MVKSNDEEKQQPQIEGQKSPQIKEQQVTYDQYAAMPDDGKRYEIFEGEMLLMSPGPSLSHQGVSRDLEFILMQSCRMEYEIYDAPLDVILSQMTVVQPDILMIHRSRLHIATKRGIEGPPDLVVEIVSPGSRKRDKMRKMHLYAKYEVPEYWIIDIDSRILEQYWLQGDRYEQQGLFEEDEVVTSDKLPCVSFPVSDIFRGMIV